MLFSGTVLDPAREVATESQKLKRNQDGNGDPGSASRPPGPAMTDFEPDTLVACEKPALYPEGLRGASSAFPFDVAGLCVNDLLKRDMEPIDAPK
jgi:hypothetical protein